MRARDLARTYVTVRLDAVAAEAARTMARERLPGLIVCDESDRPWAVLPGSQVLRFLIPAHVQADPALAAAYDEASAEQVCRGLQVARVRDVVPARRRLEDLPVVEEDATVLEVAAVMARVHSPLVAVLRDGRVTGAITVGDLLEHLLETTA